MDLNLTGQVVHVTGGSKDIGLACAAAFAAEGARYVTDAVIPMDGGAAATVV